MTIYRAARISYIMFSIPFILFLIFYTSSISEGNTYRTIPEHLQSLAPLFLILAVIYIWLGQHKLVLTNEELRYQAPFAGTKILNRSTIIDYEICIGRYLTLADRLKPLVRLIVSFKNNSSANEILEINAKVFSSQDIKRLLTLLDSDIQRNMNKRI